MTVGLFESFSILKLAAVSGYSGYMLLEAMLTQPRNVAKLSPYSISMFLMFTSFYLSTFPLQVSAEPDGSSYVFQGFIQGKDYGQFGLQRLGNSLFGFILLS